MTYVCIPGPSLETPAETRLLKQSGADAVGMSSVPEVITALHGGLRVLGLSVVANVNILHRDSSALSRAAGRIRERKRNNSNLADRVASTRRLLLRISKCQA